MLPEEQSLASLAEIGAIRAVLVHVMALRLLEEPDPPGTLDQIERHLAAAPTRPDGGRSGLDPAMSDLLAGMTDERIGGLVADLRHRLALMTAIGAVA